MATKVSAPGIEAVDDELRRYTRTVMVTQEDIDKGTKSNSSKCPVARALARTFPTAKTVMVDLQTIRLTDADTNKRIVFLTPPKAAATAVQFDAGDTVEPVRFRLRPAQVVEYATRRTPHNGTRHTPRRPKKKAALRKDGIVEGGEPIRGGGRMSGRTRRFYGSRHLRINAGKVQAVGR